MKYTPEQKNRYVTAIVVTLIACGIGVYMLPGLVPVRALFFQVAALVCLVAAVFLLVRYKTTSFTYIIRPRSKMEEDSGMEAALAGTVSVLRMNPRHLDFVVSKKQGNREPWMECVLSLGDLWEARSVTKTGEAMAKLRETYGAVDLYDYTVTLGLERALLLLFRDGEKSVAVRIEPNGELESYLISVATGNHGKETEIM